MKTLPLEIDDDLDAALEKVSSDRGIKKVDIAREAVRNYVERQQLRTRPIAPHLIALYEELSSEDIDLAEAGMRDFDRSLREADDAGPRCGIPKSGAFGSFLARRTAR